MKIYKLLLILISVTLLAACNLEAFFNIDTLEWTVEGTVENGSSLDGSTKIAAFYRPGSGQHAEPDSFNEELLIVSNIVQAVEAAAYTLNITAPAYDTYEDHSNYIDVIFWIDLNSNDELDTGEQWAPAISSNPTESIFPSWISFYSYGERDSSIGIVNWEAYSKTLVPVSYLNMTNIKIKPYKWYSF